MTWIRFGNYELINIEKIVRVFSKENPRCGFSKREFYICIECAGSYYKIHSFEISNVEDLIKSHLNKIMGIIVKNIESAKISSFEIVDVNDLLIEKNRC